MSTTPQQPSSAYKKGKSLSLSDAIRSELYGTVQKNYIVPEHELDNMLAEYNSIYSFLAGLCFAAAAIFWGFWFQCIPADKRFYLSLAGAGTIMGLICATHFVITYIRAVRRKRKLYKEATLIKPA